MAYEPGQNYSKAPQALYKAPRALLKASHALFYHTKSARGAFWSISKAPEALYKAPEALLLVLTRWYVFCTSGKSARGALFKVRVWVRVSSRVSDRNRSKTNPIP